MSKFAFALVLGAVVIIEGAVIIFWGSEAVGTKPPDPQTIQYLQHAQKELTAFDGCLQKNGLLQKSKKWGKIATNYADLVLVFINSLRRVNASIGLSLVYSHPNRWP